EGTSDDNVAKVAEIVRTLGAVLQFWLSDPQRSVQLQTIAGQSFLNLFEAMSKRLAGEEVEPVAKPDPRDKRFRDPEWSTNPYFDLLKQAYLLIVRFTEQMVTNAQGLDPDVRHRAEFYLRQITNAISPSNFILTNPELWRITIETNAENLVRGTEMLAEDIAAGHGVLRIRQSDISGFEVGRNLALTPGKVVFQNDLMQLIQYAPATH